MSLWLWRAVVGIWQVIGILLLIVVVAEFGVEPVRRVGRWLRGTQSTSPSDQRPPSGDFLGYRDDIAVRELDWAPYVHWRQRPYQGPYTTVDARGLRVTLGSDCEDANAARIFCFGGSTLFSLGARDSATIPSVLQRRLNETGIRVAITNHAQLGYNSSQDVLNLQALLKRGDVPDLAIFYNGFNDMFTAEWTGRADGIRGEETRRAEFLLLTRVRRSALLRAAVAAALPRTLRRLRDWTGFDWDTPSKREPRRPLADSSLPTLVREVVAAYAANVRIARALAREYGFQVLFVWEPSLVTKRAKSDHERQLESGGALSLEMRRRFFSAVIEEYRQREGLTGAADVLDLSALFDKREDQVYIDFAHLTEAGNAAVAEAMLPAVTAIVTAIEKTPAARLMPPRR